ncbi:hypothetical protein CSUB01_02667 [Colletotrichum sublineola]|uniref:FAD dependent oxidoreductase domain-containing protein n=1 Tax=Colletotrichum sublineola TaxID=1173701 RepID=A0A066Y148_COLSU|nr:hypothetical protein CSUB01_02667 [Colletotrichum sublineola]
MNSIDTNKMRIVIVGGGIAGLAAAAVLRQRHDVTVFEREPASAPERGGGIGIGPNGSRMLKRAFQFCPGDLKATICAGSRTYDKKGNLLRETTGTAEPFGSEWLLTHRTDLREELLRLATGDAAKLGICGPPATVVEGVEVAEVDVETGTVWLQDGREVEADVVVGADGIHSFVRQAIVGEPPRFLSTGVSLYRFTFPLDRAREILKGYPPAIDPANGGFLSVMAVDDETNRHIVFYPCRDLTTLNVIARIPDSMLSGESVTSWNAEGSPEEMLDHFFDFAPWILEIMNGRGRGAPDDAVPGSGRDAGHRGRRGPAPPPPRERRRRQRRPRAADVGLGAASARVAGPEELALRHRHVGAGAAGPDEAELDVQRHPRGAEESLAASLEHKE